MVFNGLEKSDLVIYNALVMLPRKQFTIPVLECMTGYTRSTISLALRRLQDGGYITYGKTSRRKPYSFKIMDTRYVIFNARSGLLD